MKYFFPTRLTGLVLVIGFFFACSSSKPSIDSLVENNEYELALSSIEESLLQNPNQPTLIIQKGEINIILAKQQEAENRSNFYAEAITAFDEAVNMEADSSQKAGIEEALNREWSQEHNSGTASFNNETTDADHSVTIAHFKNAILLNPGESSSYQSLATTYFTSGEIQEAIATLNTAKNSVEEVPNSLYENLGFLYLQDGNAVQSVFYFELANTDIIGNKNIAFGLVNAYISAGEREEAVSLLRELSTTYPTDGAIRNVYGTQLYLVTQEIMDDLVSAYSEGDTSLASQIRFEAEGVGEQAEQELIGALNTDSSNDDYIESLAVFYNNMTGKYLEAHRVAFDEDKTSLENKASVLLNFAIEYYQKLLESSPGSQSIEDTINSLNTLKENRFGS
ncbi:MAG: hypothetical protein ED557_04865 [Balneola sp.]|nr:MAG: hypothetical protein ED557_04865 [Balneola sp.]